MRFHQILYAISNIRDRGIKGVCCFLLLVISGMSTQAIGEPGIVMAHQSSQQQIIIRMIKHVANEHGINHYLIQAVVQVESNYNPRAVSSAGARGLMQLMPETQRELGVRNAFDPWDNLHGGVRYLIRQIMYFRDVRKGLWAYHAGPNRVEAGNVPYTTKRYADRVLRVYWRLMRRDRRYG